jgi:hypothetical protein
MRPPVQLREDYDAPDLRVLAKASRDANQTQRLLALAAIYDGAPRREAAKIGGVGVQPFDKLRSAGLGAGLQRRRSARADRLQSAGQPAAVECRAARGLAADRRGRPHSAVDGVVRWRLIALAQWVFVEFGIETPPHWWTPLLSSDGRGKVSNGPGTASIHG